SVLLLAQLAGRLAPLIESLGAYRRGADVEREHAHSRSRASPSASHVRARSTFGPLGASRTVSSWTSVSVASARRGSGSVSASVIRSASLSGLTSRASTRAGRRFVVGSQTRLIG